MCGRYTQTLNPENLIFRFGLGEGSVAFRPRYNLAPGQEAPVIINEGTRTLKFMQWGLIPSWAKDLAIGNKMINARAETLLEKPSFKRLVGKKPCLVPADGFYEWRKEGRGKVPMRFMLKGGGLFTFAGLWDSWRKPGGSELRSFTIITTEANDLIRPIHERMPVILSREDEKVWLDPNLKDRGQLVNFPCSLKVAPAYNNSQSGVKAVCLSPTKKSSTCR